MINLNVEADKIAHSLDAPFDFALKQRVIATIIDARATLIRQTFIKNDLIPIECIQAFGVKVEKEHPFGLYYKDGYKLSVKSVDTVPNPIRLDSDSPFISITSMDGSINFSFGDFATVAFNSNAGKFVSGTGRYIYHGERIALYTNNAALLTSPIVIVRGVMANPLEVKDYSGLYSYGIEKFPMPMDMLVIIRDMIRRGEFAIKPETREITLNDEK